VKNYKDFQHPVVRECFELFPKIKSLNLTTFSDIPGGTGLGSSSSFTVALLGNLMERSNSRISPRILSAQAIHLERNVLNESGGVQDQLHASYGGLRFYKLSSIGLNQGKNLSNSTIFHELNKSILLVRVGGFRKSKEMHGIEKLNRNQMLYLEKIQKIASYFHLKKFFRVNVGSKINHWQNYYCQFLLNQKNQLMKNQVKVIYLVALMMLKICL
jgi:galactokinase/mevalonate kinase-like predicted kinase